MNQALGQEVKFDMWQENPIIIDEIEECLNRFEQNNSGDLTPVIEFYYYYYTNFLKMGKDLSPLINRINSLRKHSKTLDGNLSKLYFSSIKELKVNLLKSFRKYDKRLQTNPKYEILSPSQKEAMRQKTDSLIVKLYVSNNFYPNQILVTIEDVRNAFRASLIQYEAA